MFSFHSGRDRGIHSFVLVVAWSTLFFRSCLSGSLWLISTTFCRSGGVGDHRRFRRRVVMTGAGYIAYANVMETFWSHKFLLSYVLSYS